MTDGVIKGTGNSRYLKTVPNALTLYPDWPTALQAMVDGTFPVDFNGINPNGWTTQGTKLNKGNLLTDAVANALSLTGEKTPTQAFEKLRTLINQVSTQVNGRIDNGLKAISGSFVGTGYDTNSQYPGYAQLTFSAPVRFIMISALFPASNYDETICFIGITPATTDDPNKPPLNYSDICGFIFQRSSQSPSPMPRSNGNKTVYVPMTYTNRLYNYVALVGGE